MNESVLNDTAVFESVLPQHIANGSAHPTLSFAQKCLNFFNFYYLALIIVFGMVGNTLSFLVFTRTHLKLRSSSYYLAALALADLWFLLTLLVVWLNHVGIDLFNRQGFCQAMVYGSSVSSCLSVWLTVAFTVERLIAVQYPLQRPFMCTVRRAKIIISVLTLITLSMHTYSFFTAGITEGVDGKAICDLLPDYYKFMHVVNLIDTVVTLVIPFILIVVMNTLIAKNLFVFSRTFKKPNGMRNSSGGPQHIQMKTIRMAEGGKWERDSGQGSVSNVSGQHSHHSANSCGGGSHRHHHHHHRQSFVGGRSRDGQQATTILTAAGGAGPASSAVVLAQQCHSSSSVNQVVVVNHESAAEQFNQEKLQYRNILSIRIQYSITKMLLLISTVFIMLNLPSYVIRLQVFISDVMATGSEVSSTAWVLQQFFMLLYYTNFSINFLLYSTCGATFRHCLCRLIRDKVDALRRQFVLLCSCQCWFGTANRAQQVLDQ